MSEVIEIVERSLWIHTKSNQIYRVLFLTNTESDNQERYPTSVSYQNIQNGKRYSRRADDWHRSFYYFGVECEELNRADMVYSERAYLVAAFARAALSIGWKAGVGLDSKTENDIEWRKVVYIDTPAGQVSYHVAPADQWALEGIPEYDGKWDGTFRGRSGTFATEIPMDLLDRLPDGHMIIEQAETPDGRVSQTVAVEDGEEYERIVHVDEAYGKGE